MTSRSASDHENPTGIAVSMAKGTTSKGMEVNRNLGKWLSYGREIPGTFCVAVVGLLTVTTRVHNKSIQYVFINVRP
jgi:hypothetical protein